MKRLFANRKKFHAQTLPASFTSCLSGHRVLTQGAPQAITTIKSLVSAPGDIFQTLYVETLYRMAELCQAIPLDEKAAPYSLLTYQINNSLAALRIRRGLLLPENTAAETIAEQEPRWTFAIFSASLLYGLDRLLQRQILLQNKQHNTLEHWHPFVGILLELHSAYTIEWKTSTFIVPTTALMSTFSKHIISPQVMHWFVQDKLVFNNWWETITNHEANNVIATTIKKAINSSKDNETPEYKSPSHHSTIDDITATAQQETNNVKENNVKNEVVACQWDANNFIDELLTWLYQQASHKPRSAPVFIKLRHGLLLTLSALNTFLTLKAISVSDEEIIKQLHHYLLSENGIYVFKFQHKNVIEKQHHEGIILNMNCLTTEWQQYPVTPDYIPHIPL